MSVIISEQRRPAVIFVAANVRAIRSHSPDQIRAETCTDGFDKNAVFNQEGEIYFFQLLFFNVREKMYKNIVRITESSEGFLATVDYYSCFFPL